MPQDGPLWSQTRWDMPYHHDHRHNHHQDALSPSEVRLGEKVAASLSKGSQHEIDSEYGSKAKYKSKNVKVISGLLDRLNWNYLYMNSTFRPKIFWRQTALENCDILRFWFVFMHMDVFVGAWIKKGMFFVGPQLVRVLRRSKPAMGLFFGVLEGVRTSEGRFPKEPAMYHVYHGHHGHHGHHRHHHQQLFVLWQCWCQGKVSCNSSEGRNL